MSFGNFGFSEILIIAMIVLIFFGPRRMPEIGRAVGGALREFRRGLNEIQRELQEAERAAKVDPDVPGAKTGSTATTASKPSTSESSISELPTPLAAAMASPSEPHSVAPAETASVEETTDVESEETEAASEETADPTEKEEGSERAG